MIGYGIPNIKHMHKVFKVDDESEEKGTNPNDVNPFSRNKIERFLTIKHVSKSEAVKLPVAAQLGFKFTPSYGIEFVLKFVNFIFKFLFLFYSFSLSFLILNFILTSFHFFLF